MKKMGRNEKCHCGSGKKYKKCCIDKNQDNIPTEVLEYFRNNPPTPEPFEKGGFLTGRPFITETFQGIRVRAVGNIVYKRAIDETFHIFLFRRLSEILTPKWVEAEEKKEVPHQLIQWYTETQKVIYDAESGNVGEVRGVKLTGNMRALLALAYDFYSLQHCAAPVLPRLLNRLRDPRQFQGARYEIAVAGLACRAGFEIEWVNTTGKHCEFTGVHKVTKEKAAFEVKSHYREGVLGHGEGNFNAEGARVKIMDHIKEAVAQAPTDDIPLIIFDDLNLPLTAKIPLNEKRWFKEVEQQLEKYGFLSMPEYARCGALYITNFSWHFHTDIPPERNEIITYFHSKNKYSLKPETVLNFLELAAQQYGSVPMLQHEFPDSGINHK